MEGEHDGGASALREWYGWWAEPLRVADDDEGNARYAQNPVGVDPPQGWWRTVPCGHPQSPVAWLDVGGIRACHCGAILAREDDSGVVDLIAAEAFEVEHPDGPIVTCSRCGCYVLVIAHEAGRC